MMKSRMEAEATEAAFKDPLSNYEPRQIDDPVERALAEKHVDTIQSRPVQIIPKTMPVARAVELLASLRIGCLLVADGLRLVGIFSEQDVLQRIGLEYDAVSDLPISEFMTPHPVFVREDDCAAKALCVMAVSGYRHVPVLDDDDRIVGIVSPMRVTNFLQRHFKG